MAEIKPVKGGIHKFFVTAVLLAILVFFLIGTRWESRQRDPLVYRDSLEMKAVTVNGNELTLRDLAFYVAYEEAEVQRQAVVYDADNPIRYWNANMGGTYTRVAARNISMQMAIHDEVFYQMAMEEGIELSEADESALADVEQDFWSDLIMIDGDQRMGISEKDIQMTMRKMALAQKYQEIYAELNNKSYEDYDFTEAPYKKLLKKQDYKIHDKVWKRVSMGSITLNQ
ncbi:MAG: hypothetical protein PUA77_08075 [Lachnospiraceae bacterium]|nr:hypothetical protein [Agathobacter sp.]MDD6291726.1 hypothetical protein [Lachnospiraceae bacterium]